LPTDWIDGSDRLLVLVAHPDDETFGCGSLIAHAATVGAPVTVACATRGDAGERADEADEDLGLIREAELRAAGALLGVDEIVVLGYRDSGWDGPPPAGSLCEVPFAEVVDVVSRLIDESDPSVVVVLQGDDGHRDHQRILDALAEAWTRRGRSERRAYAVGLPNSLMRRWAAEMAAIHPESVYLVGDLDALGSPDAQLDEIDLAPYLFQREAAIREHRSQRSPFDEISPELRRAFLSSTFVRVLAQ
jgi:LmbE family N-acetylglucosaminyl deacetylase